MIASLTAIKQTLSQTQWPPKRFTFCLTFTHSLTHSYTDGSFSHARRRPTHRE